MVWTDDNKTKMLASKIFCHPKRTSVIGASVRYISNILAESLGASYSCVTHLTLLRQADKLRLLIFKQRKEIRKKATVDNTPSRIIITNDVQVSFLKLVFCTRFGVFMLR